MSREIRGVIKQDESISVWSGIAMACCNVVTGCMPIQSELQLPQLSEETCVNLCYCQICVHCDCVVTFSTEGICQDSAEKKSVDCFFPNSSEEMSGGQEERILMGEEGEISSADS